LKGSGSSAQTFKEEILGIEQRRDAPKAEIAAAREPPPLHPKMAALCRDRVARLHEALADETTWVQAAEIIRSLVEEIRLVREDGRLRIDLKGDLAGILSVAAHSKAPSGYPTEKLCTS
jgi:hypothetical protein